MDSHSRQESSAATPKSFAKALQRALEEDEDDVMKFLRKRPRDVGAQYMEVLEVVVKIRMAEAVILLIERYPTSDDKRVEHFSSALYTAICWGSTEVSEILLEAGAKIPAPKKEDIDFFEGWHRVTKRSPPLPESEGCTSQWVLQ